MRGGSLAVPGARVRVNIVAAHRIQNPVVRIQTVDLQRRLDGLWPDAGQAGACGNSRDTSVPWPGLLRISSLPPWASRTLAAMARPMPVPDSPFVE